jgi:hypothetical protein
MSVGFLKNLGEWLINFESFPSGGIFSDFYSNSFLLLALQCREPVCEYAHSVCKHGNPVYKYRTFVL